MLHNNTELFEQIVLHAAEQTGVEAGIIEKDYYVTLMLKAIARRVPNVVFRGGTSLSKCYNLIKRFSEDIDLTLEFEKKATEAQRRALKKNIIDSIEELEFQLVNADEVRSRRDFNKYIIAVPSIFETETLKQHLQIETMVKIRAYPSEAMNVGSIVYGYLSESGLNEIIEQHELMPFQIKVQSAERTFVDKIFALMDYYLSGRIEEHSRHIYDLYKLLSIVNINDGLKRLFREVRIERKPHDICVSAKDDVDIETILGEIISKEIYKSDYTQITESLLFESVEYGEAIQAIETIKDSELW